MAIQFACSCGRMLQADEGHAGRRVKCPACGAEITVPSEATAVQTAEPTAPRSSPVQAEEPPSPATDDERRRRRREADDDDDRPRRRRFEDDDEDDDQPPRADQKTSGKAVAALVLGLLSCGITGLPAIILGIISLIEINNSRGRLRGKGMAVAGLVLGGLSFLAAPVMFGLLIPAVQKVREAAGDVQSKKNLVQMAIAMHNFNDANGHLPEPVPDPKLKGQTKLSWRVQVLPYVEQGALYNAFHHDEPWDSAHNQALLTSMPPVFAHPNHPQENAQGLTYYRVFVGEHTPFPPGKLSRFPQNFPDGTSNTILIIEAADPVPWTKPDELAYDPNKPLPRLGGHSPRGTNAALGDGSVVTLRIGRGLSEQTLRSAIDPNDGRVLGGDWP